MKKVSDDLTQLEKTQEKIEGDYAKLILTIPNLNLDLQASYEFF